MLTSPDVESYLVPFEDAAHKRNMQPLSDKHRAAQQYARAGIAIFPCAPGSKKPRAGSQGFHEATTDLDQIDAWWTEEPEYNPAACPDQFGCAVIDLDGEQGARSWAELTSSRPFPVTRTVTTPHGSHLYARGLLPPTQSLLGLHIDTRGTGSYALLPPSTLADGGRYQWADESEPAPLPAWIGELIGSMKATRQEARTEHLDEPGNVERYRTHLRQLVASGRVAIEGQNGDKTTFVVACVGLELGLTASTVLCLMSDIWNPACEPPWDLEELQTKVENAARYAQNEAGAWGTETGEETFGSVLDKLGLRDPALSQEPGAFKRGPRFTRHSFAELRLRPPPAWLIPDRLPDKRVTLLFGPPGGFKSFIALNDALTLASLGRPVLYVCGEGVLGVTQRIAAWAAARQTDVDSLPFALVEDMPMAMDPEDVKAFILASADFGPELVILDTVRRAMLGLNENDARDMSRMVASADLIKNSLDCAVLLIHHTRKDGQQASGSGALWAGTDAAIEAVAEADQPHDHPLLSLHVRRMKDARERELPFRYEGLEIAESLVFQTMREEAFKQHSRPTKLDPYPPQLVQAVLDRLGATAPQIGVTTRALAGSLHVPHPDETPEQQAVNLDRLTNELNRRARGPLSELCSGERNDRRWFSPVSPTTQHHSGATGDEANEES